MKQRRKAILALLLSASVAASPIVSATSVFAEDLDFATVEETEVTSEDAGSVFIFLMHFYQVSAVVLFGDDGIFHGIHAGYVSGTVDNSNINRVSLCFFVSLYRYFICC